MKKETMKRLLFGAAAFCCVMYLFFGSPFVHINNVRLKKSLTSVSQEEITLEEVIPFKWTTVFTFDPYTPKRVIQKATGSTSAALKESVSEGMTHIVFMNGSCVAASVCAYPASVGYSIWFTGGKNTYYPYQDGGYSRIDNGDNVVFHVENTGDYVVLTAHIED